MSAAVEYFQYVLAPQMLIGLVLGVAVILVALGLTIIFGLLDVINMSHGEFYALGAFIAAGARIDRAAVLAAADPGSAHHAAGRLHRRTRH